MVKEFLKIAGVKTQAEFYKKYPSEEAFFRAHPEARDLVNQKMAYGGMYAYKSGGAQQGKIVQLIQLYAKMNGVDPKQIMQQLQKMKPQEKQIAIQQMVQTLQQTAGAQQGGIPAQPAMGPDVDQQSYMQFGGLPTINYNENYMEKGGNYSGTYSGGVYYQEGGAYVPEYGDNAYGVLPKYGMGAMGVPPAMYGMGMRDGGQNNTLQKFVNAGYSLDYLEQGGPTYSNVTAYNHQGVVPAFDWLKEGGPTFSKQTSYPHQQYVPALDWLQEGGVPMPADQATAEQQAAQQGQQQGPDPQQVMQMVAQMLQQGIEPGQILQELVKQGIPEDMAQQVIQQVMQQMQGAQQPQQGMMRSGGLVKGSVHDVSEYDVQDLINKGYKIQYL